MNRTAFSIVSRYKFLLTKKRSQLQELGEFIEEIEYYNNPLEASMKDKLRKQESKMAEEIEEIECFLNELKLRYKLV